MKVNDKIVRCCRGPAILEDAPISGKSNLFLALPRYWTEYSSRFSERNSVVALPDLSPILTLTCPQEDMLIFAFAGQGTGKPAIKEDAMWLQRGQTSLHRCHGDKIGNGGMGVVLCELDHRK